MVALQKMEKESEVRDVHSDPMALLVTKTAEVS